MSDTADSGMTPERERGLAMMTEVYGFDMSDGPGDYFGETADHLFGRIWARPGLSHRDRRLLLLGALTAQGNSDIADIQVARPGPQLLRPVELEEIVLSSATRVLAQRHQAGQRVGPYGRAPPTAAGGPSRAQPAPAIRAKCRGRR